MGYDIWLGRQQAERDDDFVTAEELQQDFESIAEQWRDDLGIEVFADIHVDLGGAPYISVEAVRWSVDGGQHKMTIADVPKRDRADWFHYAVGDLEEWLRGNVPAWPDDY